MDPPINEAVVDLLACVPLLQTVDRETLAKLAVKVEITEHEAGEVIFKKGAPATGLMVVALGRVKVTATAPNGMELLLNIVEEGEIFGELALIDGGVRSADVTTIGTTGLLRLSKDAFDDFLMQHPSVALHVMRVLCERLRHATTVFEEAAFLDFPAGLARRLSALAEEHGAKTSEGVLIEGKFSEEELAQSVGATLSSVTQQLAVWEDRGLIRLEAGSILLISPDKLRDAAE